MCISCKESSTFSTISISLESNIVPKLTEKNTTYNNAVKLQMWINLNVETKDEYWAMFSAVDIEDNFRTMVQQVTSSYSDAFAVKKKKNYLFKAKEIKWKTTETILVHVGEN